MLSRQITSFLMSALIGSYANAADESPGTVLPAPSLTRLTAASTAVTVTNGQAVVDVQVERVRSGSRVAWAVPAFRWVTMDADDRDPAFSEIVASANGNKLLMRREATAWLDSRDVSASLRSAQVDILHVSLGDIDGLPHRDAPRLHKGDSAYAYFRDIDGTLFPAWATHVRTWADVPATTRQLSYAFRLRPGFFLVAGNADAAAQRIQANCMPNLEQREQMLASLRQANLVCLYRLPLPATEATTSVTWRSSEESNDDYICRVPSAETFRKVQGVATFSGSDVTEIRAVVITKGDHCEQ